MTVSTMSILWDAPMTAALARALADRLDGARLRAVRMDRERRNLVLHFRERTLLFRLHPLHGDVSLHPPRDPGPGAAGLKARVRRIHAPPDERVLMMQLQPSGGSPTPEGLVVELMTNQWNAVWIDVATDRIRRVLWPREAGARRLAAGETYEPPPPSERAGIDEPLDPDAWLGLLESEEPKARRGVLLRTVAFTSSINVPALLGWDSDPPTGMSARVARDADELDRPDAPDDHRREGRDDRGAHDDRAALLAGHATWTRLREVALGREDVEPYLVDTEKRVVPYPLPLDVGHGPPVPVASFLDGVAAAASADDGGEPTASALLPTELLERLEGAVEDAETRSDRLREELAGLPDEEPIRRKGDLILARFGQVEKGAERVRLEGFDGEPVEVRLDPALTPQENADAYYREAARIERARDRLPDLIEEAETKASDLAELLEDARAGSVSPESLEARLPAPRPSRGGRTSRDEPKLPYRSYRSAGGLEIRVGRGAKANDDLTFHHSSPDDVWLHARQVAGAHVILRWQDDGNPPARDLAQAASLAALHSDARHAASVPVDWTRRKYVRSPRKAPPGVVVPDRVQTVFVDPDPELEKRLRK